jgi:Ferritin-like domain
MAVVPGCGVGDAVCREAGAVYSRRHLVALAAGAGGGLFLSGVAVERMLGATSPVPSATQDAKILNYALLLEYIQAAFYTEALTRGKLRGELREFAEVVGEHEHAHVAFLKKALGRAARAEPVFHFGHATRNSSAFRTSARALEDAGVAAYNGQAANLTKRALGAAIKIVSVEARHAAWIRDIAGVEPAPRAADPGWSAGEVTDELKSLRLLG